LVFTRGASALTSLGSRPSLVRECVITVGPRMPSFLCFVAWI